VSDLGYTGTPQLPDSKYCVHDPSRPQPRIVTPGTCGTPEWPGTAPSDAIVLFDGTSLDGWIGANGQPPAWKLQDGYMEVVARTHCLRTRQHFGDCQLHVEWAAPAEVVSKSQGRGNSGVFLQGIYEIQVLDCYQNPTYADGATGALYGQLPPLVNACRPPGQWQSYDIVWIGPKFDGQKLVSPARLTLFFNGVLLHHDVTLIGPTAHKTILPYTAHPPTGPLELQDHGDPVRYRNIWYRPLKGYDQ